MDLARRVYTRAGPRERIRTGKALAMDGYRTRAFLMTKVCDRDYAVAMKHLRGLGNLQFEQHVLAPIPLQAVRDLLLFGRDQSIAQLSQLLRIPLPRPLTKGT